MFKAEHAVFLIIDEQFWYCESNEFSAKFK